MENVQRDLPKSRAIFFLEYPNGKVEEQTNDRHLVYFIWIISVPPRWTIEPSDANIAASQGALIHCQADGYPKPVITWKKAVGKFYDI